MRPDVFTPGRRVGGYGAGWRQYARSFGMTPAMLRDPEAVSRRLARLAEQRRSLERREQFLRLIGAR